MELTDTERESVPTGMEPHPSGPIPVLAETEPVAALNPADSPEQPLGRCSGQGRGRPTGPSPQLAPPPQFGRSSRFAPPPQFGRPPPFVRQQAYHQADPGSPRSGAQPALEAPALAPPGFEDTGFEDTGFEDTAQQQRDGVAPTGPPDIDVPATGQVPGPLADYGARAISFLIDYVTPVIVLNILLSIGVATGNVVLRSVLAAVGCLGLAAFGLWNSGYLQGTTGQSVGRRVARTKLVKIETGQPVGFGMTLLRQFCHSLEFFVGFLWPLWDDKRQTFADKIVGTVVIRVEGATEDRSGNSPRRLVK
ncbi:MAG: RDD family protein [Pseudonocardiaceae bacterium]